MSEPNKQNRIITYIFELELIKSVDEVKEFMRENSSPYVYNCSEPKTIRFEWFLSEDEKSATLIEMFEDSDAAKLRLENHSASHLVEEFPEHFEIKQFIVLGDIKSDMREKLADWNADLRENVAGFFKGTD
jgi:quinol monooxygenase YgiN